MDLAAELEEVLPLGIGEAVDSRPDAEVIVLWAAIGALATEVREAANVDASESALRRAEWLSPSCTHKSVA